MLFVPNYVIMLLGLAVYELGWFLPRFIAFILFLSGYVVLLSLNS